MLAIFLAAMGFFAVVVFLPRWYQVVGGTSATEAGYQILPLLGGLIISAVASGQIVARTGRYKALIFGALLVFAVGLFLLSNLRADTPEPLIWLWMAVTGLGVGPTFAVFTLVVQNSVPVRQLGTATSNVTLFQQLGGTVGLAITGTIFGSVMLEEVPRQMSAAGVPDQVVSGFQSGGGSTLNDLSRVGDLGASILSQVPEAVSGSGRAVHTGHGRWHPRGDLDRDRVDVRRRDRDVAARGTAGARAPARREDGGGFGAGGGDGSGLDSGAHGLTFGRTLTRGAGLRATERPRRSSSSAS